MYKKPFSVQAQNLLSKKDLKALKSQLVEAYGGVDAKVFDELLPEGQVKLFKLDTKCLLYAIGDGPPAFFDAEGRGEIYPTLTTLWQQPMMMPELTIHPEVSKFVLKGADLMLPGVLLPANGVAGFGTVTKGQRRCIRIEGNPYPIAVGKMLVNQTQMEKMKGKGLEVLHVFRDQLWEHSGKHFPNEGFREKEDEVTPCADATWSPGAATAAPAAAGGGGYPAAAAAATSCASAAPTLAAAPAAAESKPAGADASQANAASARPADDWSQDDLLDFCLLQALKLSLVDEKALPVEASDLYEKHMKPARPEGTTLDVKKSSHKQIGKYLNSLRKSKVIDVVEKKNVVNVTKVDRGHKWFTQMSEKFAGDMAAASQSSAAAAAPAAAAAGLPPPTITTLWKVGHYLEGLFKSMGKRKDDLFTFDAAKEVLSAYVKQEGLGPGDDSAPVKLNEELLNALVKTAGGEKKGTTLPEELSFEELEDKMTERMQEHTRIDVAGVGETIRKGQAVKIEMALSKKGAHNVTKVQNLEYYGINPQAIADDLKKKFSCTVNVEDMPGKNAKDKLLQLQGHLHHELAEFLLKQYGITAKFISVK
eukprot:TRINITY_DN72980_c0_g1_i1.p1 TRINITY_DN72980_c0_g1~~TRINITY_DN72980_c0_g1_i1.p1  ORF type:complete len:592 (-),score=175.50 TRINITY_DN72980_c0_g1_i1:126-1901(-)